LLTGKQVYKLKVLSLISLLCQKKVLSYGEIEEYLDIYTTRQTEDLIIDSIYSNMVCGKMDHKNRLFYCDSVVPHEIPLMNIQDEKERIGKELDNWIDSIETAVSSINANIKFSASEKDDKNNENNSKSVV
jgi:COP9 signalosome complex subunit 7